MSALHSSSFGTGARSVIGALLLTTLASCASTTEPIPPCCYTGEVALAHVRDVQLALADGNKIGFQQAFPGYATQSGVFTTGFPFNKVEIAQVTYGALRPVLPQYDANENGNLEQPELTVLYIREAALGLGLKVDHVATNDRVDALILSQGEIGGLVRYVDANFERMTAEAQDIFKKLKLVGLDQRSRGTENDNRKMKKIFIP